MPTPRLSYGNIASYVVWLNADRVANKGLVDADWVVRAMKAAWSLFDPLGVIYLTTEWPGLPRPYARRGLRPGEYLEVEVVEDATFVDGAAGYSPKNQHHNTDIWCGCKAYVLAGRSAEQVGVNAVHEAGHALLPPKGPWGNLTLHTTDPRNVMWGGGLTLPLSWSREQLLGWGWGLYRVRTQGLRWTAAGDEVPVSDGGVPAWPLKV